MISFWPDRDCNGNKFITLLRYPSTCKYFFTCGNKSNQILYIESFYLFACICKNANNSFTFLPNNTEWYYSRSSNHDYTDFFSLMRMLIMTLLSYLFYNEIARCWNDKFPMITHDLIWRWHIMVKSTVQQLRPWWYLSV